VVTTKHRSPPSATLPRGGVSGGMAGPSTGMLLLSTGHRGQQTENTKAGAGWTSPHTRGGGSLHDTLLRSAQRGHGDIAGTRHGTPPLTPQIQVPLCADACRSLSGETGGDGARGVWDDVPHAPTHRLRHCRIRTPTSTTAHHCATSGPGFTPRPQGRQGLLRSGGAGGEGGHKASCRRCDAAANVLPSQPPTHTSNKRTLAVPKGRA
jgi:hypothetical protein